MNMPSPSDPFSENRLNSALDYRSEWDVQEINKKVTDWLESSIRDLQGRTQPNPAQVIPVLLSPSGYGKTHLFGRLAHKLGKSAFLVFIPQIENIHRPDEHIRRHFVESLFHAPGGEPSFLQQLLAELCYQSFASYLEWLPASLAAQVEQVRGQIQEEPLALLNITKTVQQALPFLKLADSVANRFGSLRGDVVRAMVLGLSPDVMLARRWLRGETIPEADLKRLGLSEEPPSTGAVIHAVVELARRQKPIVICCDQLEAALVDMKVGPVSLSTALVGLLQSVPNQCLIVSCLKDRWQDFVANAHTSFQSRARPESLDSLTPEHAVELVSRRLASLERNGEQPPCWPFKEETIRQLFVQQKLGPRGLIIICAEAFKRWREKSTNGWIDQLPYGDEPPLDKLFLDAWNKELEAIRKDPKRSPDELAEDRLHRAVKETLKFLQESKRNFDGVRIAGVVEKELVYGAKKTKSPFLHANLTAGSTSLTVIVAATKIDNGTTFRGYFHSLMGEIKGIVKGAVLLHPKEEIRMGEVGRKEFDEVRDKSVRAFPLVGGENRESFARMECFLALLDKARGGELQIGNTMLSDGDCIDHVIRSAALDNLNLYESLFQNWTEGLKEEKRRNSEGPSKPVPPPVPDPPRREGETEYELRGKVSVEEEPAPIPTPPLQKWADECMAKLTQKLKLHGLPVEPIEVEIGPTFARLKVRPQGRTTVNRIRNKAEDLKVYLELEAAPLIGSHAGYLGVDVQHPQRQSVSLAPLLQQAPSGKDGQPIFPVGVDVAGQPHWLNLADPSDCHLLVAGTTGSGKSEFLKAMLAGLALRLPPDQLQFVLIDPKRVTFNFSGESPYFLRPIAYTVDEAIPLIEECFAATERRYELLQHRKLENISELKGSEAEPRILLIIDEFADLMADKESKKALEAPLKRIGALARAAGIHLVLATQRPEANVVTPLLRSNLPGRIALRVAGDNDSKLIIGTPDGSNLLGRGDLLWRRGGGLLRLQCPLVSKQELEESLRMV